MALERSTLRETVARLTTDYGIRDYLQQFYLIHGTGSDEAESLTEGALVRRMAKKPDPLQMELEKLFKRTSHLIQESVRLLALIAPLPAEGKAVTPTEMKSLHESLFRSLYQIRINLRMMFEVAFDCGDDPEKFAARLKKKYKLVDGEMEAFTTVWADTYESICQELLEQRIRVKVFTGDDECFRLDNEDGSPFLGVPRHLMTENKLIISKYYFFLQILTVLKHVEVMTKISALEKNQPYKDEGIPVTEMFEMDVIFPIAEEFMDLE